MKQRTQICAIATMTAVLAMVGTGDLWAQDFEIPSELGQNDKVLAELTSLASNTVFSNVDVEPAKLRCVTNHVLFSNIIGAKQVRFMFSITNSPGPIVTLNSKSGKLLAYVNPFPASGNATVSSNDAIAVAEAFLTKNELELVTGVPSRAVLQELGSGGNCWLVYRGRISSDGTPSDAAVSVFVDAATTNVLSFQSGYELEDSYGAVTVTEQQARAIVRDRYGASIFDQATVTSLLRIVNCIMWALENQEKRSVKVWHITVTSPSQAEDKRESDYFVNATTGMIIREEHLPL